MNKIELICTLLGAIAIILSGVWFIVAKAMKIGRNNYRLDSVEDTQKRQADDIDIIKQWIMKIDNTLIGELSFKRSPRVISSLGKKVLSISGADQILAKVCDSLLSEMETKKIKTPFDAETEAYFTVIRHDSDDAFNGLKNYIYNAPETITIEVDGVDIVVKLDYMSILRLISLDLRDLYIARHPEITENSVSADGL